MQYSQALDYLSELAPRGWRLGLDRMQAFVEGVGLGPFVRGETGCRFIHVAGTNGKGSTTAFLQSMLVECGLKAGAFFSPYVVDPRERVQIGRDLISKAEFAEIVTYLADQVEKFGNSVYGGITEFEFKTAVGFECWKRHNCEAVALEVGLGGRLDATNVVTPASCAIVSIGLDHVAILGDTLAKIATEKAGILKPKTPAVIGQMEGEALRAIEIVAARVGAPLWRVGHEVRLRKASSGVEVTTPRSQIYLEPSLAGEIQLHNVAVAYAAVELATEVNQDAAKRGAATASIPGRFQRIQYQNREILVDGAHNGASAEVLAKALKTLGYRRIVGVTGMLNGHEVSAFYGPLREIVTAWHVSPIDFDRAKTSPALAKELRALGLSAEAHASLHAALDAACQEDSDLVIVTGSFYLVGEIMRHVAQAQLQSTVAEPAS